ncbi:MAG: LPS export ABC transporter periplasmic protein LptC [Akkermansia sp.]|nr:LPS export ABC transporter periplasmic protein LptC [Akkermansia sp.]
MTTHTQTLIKLTTVAALMLPLWAADPTDDVGQKEFPGLQLLPEGSVVKGIVLPRYEKHRVSALMMADELRIDTRSLVSLKNLRAELYSPAGGLTTIMCGITQYDFSKDSITTDQTAAIKDSRFSAKGKGISFSTRTQLGILKGPVRTTFTSSAFSSAKGK